MADTTVQEHKKNPFFAVTDFFKNVAMDFVHGDAFVKLSALIMGAGFFRRKQIIKGVIATVFQVVIIIFAMTFAAHYLSKFGTLGTVQFETVFNAETMRNEINDYDHSFLILLYGVVSIIVLAVSVFIYLSNIRAVRALEIRAIQGKRITTFKEDVRSFIDERFHVTLLSFPCLGIILFTIVPLIIMISVAFTNL